MRQNPEIWLDTLNGKWSFLMGKRFETKKSISAELLLHIMYSCVPNSCQQSSLSGWSMKNQRNDEQANGNSELKTFIGRQYSRADVVPSEDYPVNQPWKVWNGMEVHSFIQEMSTTQGLTCLVWPRSFSFDLPSTGLGGSINLTLWCIFFVVTWPGEGSNLENPLPASLTLHSATFSIVFLKKQRCRCLRWQDKSCWNHPTSLFTHLQFCILPGLILVTQNTDLTFLNLTGYSVNMVSWRVC